MAQEIPPSLRHAEVDDVRFVCLLQERFRHFLGTRSKTLSEKPITHLLTVLLICFTLEEVAVYVIELLTEHSSL